MGNTSPVPLKCFAVKLRVLSGPEKNKYLYQLNEFAKDFRMPLQKRRLGIFFHHYLAGAIYCSLEGIPYTQPEFASLVSEKDVRARNKINLLVAGIITYAKATDIQRTEFKKSIFKKPNLFDRVIHWAKTRSNGMA